MLGKRKVMCTSTGCLDYAPERYKKYDIDIRSLLAGADSKKIKPKYWIGKK